MSLKTTGLMISIGAMFTGATTLSATTTAISKLETKIGKLKESKTTLKVDSTEYALADKRIGILNSSLEKLKANQKKLEANKTKREDFRNSMMDKIALGATVVAPAKLAIDFESSMADVKKVVNSDSKEEAKKLEQDILDLSTRIPIKATGLAEIVASGGQLGIAKDKLLDFTKITAKMSTAFDMSANEAGESSATLMNVFKLSVTEIESLGDALNHLSDNSASKARDLVNVLAKVGGSSKVFGISAEQTASLASAFLSMGKPVEVTGTAINAILGTLGNAEGQGKKFKEALEQIGLSAEELKQNVSENGEGAIVDFLTRLKDVEQSEKMGILTNLFGKEYADDVALLTEGIENYTDAIELLKDKESYKGSMNKEFEARSATTANKMTLLGNSIQRIGISFGTALLPVISVVTDFFAGWARKIGDLVIEFPKLTTTVASFLAGGIGLSILLPAIGYYATFVHDGFLKLKNVTTILSSTFKLFSTILNFTTLKTKAYTVWQGISTVATKSWTFAKNLASASLTRFRAIVVGTTIVTKFWVASLGLGAIASKGLATATLFLNKAFGIAKIGVRTLIGATGIGLLLVAAGLIYEYWTPITNFFSNIWDNIKIGFNEGVNYISNAFTSPIEAITTVWDNMFNWLSSKFEWIGKSIEWVKGVGSGIGDFFSFGKETIKNTALTTATATSLAIAPVPQMDLKEKSISNTVPIQSIINTASKQPNSVEHNNYNITINVTNPTSNVDIEKAVKKAIADLKRDNFNREIS
ncbi:phage tail tape measure protein [Aliarcobacter cryaerophilus]|uniref:phage tail tape measure protein n=1 Tax=Aliarcobacter cryaerophilus TaxID=28198 RepID=UPI0021B68B48|nr:phage tail tape measure protein [Aliarcobacter cryaerophilus]MCT7405606.1 phage tail tape measure protein [Aliarcobacter cryaerophilus]MCT7503451.1 phage tail tape measure protein [Aliarcobacter cryaerophilus]